MKKKLLLTILDGWGENKNPKYNAIEVGKTPTWHKILDSNPHAHLITFGKEVGLPDGQMGNSEVGHTNIGAGRVVFQELPRINNAIADKSFDAEKPIQETIALLKKNQQTLHLMGLFSDGGVHSHISHFLHCMELFAKENIKVTLHLFTDGRDTPPQSALTYITQLQPLLEKYKNITIGTICGRYYALDRDHRWERITLAYNAIVAGKAPKFNTAIEAIKNSYNSKITDEFIKPVVIGNYAGINNNDAIFMVNFRSDRVRQILNAILEPKFNDFTREKVITVSKALAMVSYSDTLQKIMQVIFKPQAIKNSLGEWLASHNCHQLRVAETEKYPHVTFFFNCGQEKPFKNEERILIDSPKVATYDLQPEMSAYKITEKLTVALDSQKFDFIVVNYANGDMVGHTGILEAAAKATEAVDVCLAKLEQSIIKNDYIWVIIADHGNCETMWDIEKQIPHTQHTTNLVNIILYAHGHNVKELHDGKLADVAPTILELLSIEKPQEMNGKVLLKK
ncbi:2,3-bisphosphoglycerate-independent phosphoglycerate mutase [Candidatus Hepatincola sp. Av]